MTKKLRSFASAIFTIAGLSVTGFAWAYCCLDSGQCTHNPHNSCGLPINDWYAKCEPNECCHIREYQCYEGDTCRARDAAPMSSCLVAPEDP